MVAQCGDELAPHFGLAPKAVLLPLLVNPQDDELLPKGEPGVWWAPTARTQQPTTLAAGGSHINRNIEESNGSIE